MSKKPTLRQEESPMTHGKVRYLHVVEPANPDTPHPAAAPTRERVTRLTMAKPANGAWQYPLLPKDWSQFVAWEYHQWTAVPTGIEGLRLMMLTPGHWEEPRVLAAMRAHQPEMRTLWPLATGTGGQQLLRRLGPIQQDVTRRGEPLRMLWSKDDVDYILAPSSTDTPTPWTIWDLSVASEETRQSYRLFIAAPENKSAQWITRALVRQLMLTDTTRWWWDMINQGRTTLAPLADAAYDPTAGANRLVAWLPIPGFHLIFAETASRSPRP